MWSSTFLRTGRGTFAWVIGRERKVRRRPAQTGGLRSPTGEALLSWAAGALRDFPYVTGTARLLPRSRCRHRSSGIRSRHP